MLARCMKRYCGKESTCRCFVWFHNSHPSMKKSDLLLFCLLVFFGSSSIDAAGWSRTAIAKTFLLYDTSGIPILDQYGDPIPSLPGGYLPSS